MPRELITLPLRMPCVRIFSYLFISYSTPYSWSVASNISLYNIILLLLIHSRYSKTCGIDSFSFRGLSCHSCSKPSSCTFHCHAFLNIGCRRNIGTCRYCSALGERQQCIYIFAQPFVHFLAHTCLSISHHIRSYCI